MEPEELERAVEAVLFAAGEPVELKRLSQALGCETGEVQEAANRLMDFPVEARNAVLRFGSCV